MTYSGASWIKARQPEAAVESGDKAPAMVSTRRQCSATEKACVAVGLAVPAGDAGKPMSDVLDLDVERRGIEQIEPAPAQHALPGARRTGCLREGIFMPSANSSAVDRGKHGRNRLHNAIH